MEMKKQLEQARQFNDTSQFEQALKALREPINAAKSGTDSSILSQLLVEKGIALKRQGQTTEAVETYQWALKVATKLEDRRQQAVIHTNLAVIANEVGDQDRAQALVLRALKLHRELKNSRSEGLVSSISAPSSLPKATTAGPSIAYAKQRRSPKRSSTTTSLQDASSMRAQHSLISERARTPSAHSESPLF